MNTSPLTPLCYKCHKIIVGVVMLLFVLTFPAVQWEVWSCLHGTFGPTKGCGAVWLWCGKRSSGWSRRWLQWKRHSTTDSKTLPRHRYVLGNASMQNRHFQCFRNTAERAVQRGMVDFIYCFYADKLAIKGKTPSSLRGTLSKLVPWRTI